MVARKATILHLIETTGPGGAETVLLNIVRRLDPLEFASSVIVTGTGWLYENLSTAGITTTILESARANDWQFVLRLVRHIKRFRVDLIHSHLAGMNFYACLAGMLCCKPVITTYHGLIGDWQARTLKNRVRYAFITRAASAVVTVSDFLRRELLRAWGFKADRVFRIYNGADLRAFENGTQGTSVRAQFGLPESTSLVGMVGNIRRPKGYEYFVQAARLVIDRRPECYFLIVGEGKGELLEKLREQIAALKLEQKVLIVGFRDDVPQILRQLDVFALSSISEGLSIATIEAMAAGLPVVVTDSGWPTEIVEHGVTGLVVPPAAPEALAEKILLLLEDRNLANTLACRAQNTVRSRFDLDMCVQNYVDLYRRCLAR
jgi:glycosyltransferase involved in cell wall biosynthesis